MSSTAPLPGPASYLPVVVVGALGGCNDFSFSPISKEPPPAEIVVVVEEFVQEQPPALDLLIVMDDTPSMEQKQSFVAENLVGLLDGLDDAGVAWQVGVVRTDPSGPFAGWLQGSPWVLTPSTPDRDQAFRRQVEVGATGAQPESGVEMAALALDLAAGEGPNRGFRRPGALLHVVFVSDSDDDSTDAGAYDALRDHLAEAEVDSGYAGRVSAIVGLPPSGCTSARGGAQPAILYEGLAAETGGVASSICAPDLAGFAATLADVATVWRSEFPLREEPDGDVLVLVDGATVRDFTVVDGVLVLGEAPRPGAIVKVAYPVELDEGA